MIQVQKEWEIPTFAEVLQTTSGYVINGKKVPRVTTICNMINKPGLYFWYGKHGTKKCKKISTESKEFGSLFHRIAELKMNGQTVNIKQYEKDMRGCYYAFNKWRKQREFGHVETEVVLHNQEFQYAGTCDLAATIDDMVGVVDWKTGADMYLEHLLQVSAYMVSFEEMTGVTPEFGGVLILGKDGTYLYRQFSWKLALRLHHYFLAALALWRWNRMDWMAKTYEERG